MISPFCTTNDFSFLYNKVNLYRKEKSFIFSVLRLRSVLRSLSQVSALRQRQNKMSILSVQQSKLVQKGEIIYLSILENLCRQCSCFKYFSSLLSASRNTKTTFVFLLAISPEHLWTEKEFIFCLIIAKTNAT